MSSPAKPYLDRVLAHFPEVNDTVDLVHQISDGAKFPINSISEIEHALGGVHTQFVFGGRRLRVADIRHLVPPYYFPITSADDLIAKIADLRTRRPTPALTRPAQGATASPADLAAVGKRPNTPSLHQLIDMAAKSGGGFITLPLPDTTP